MGEDVHENKREARGVAGYRGRAEERRQAADEERERACKPLLSKRILDAWGMAEKF